MKLLKAVWNLKRVVFQLLTKQHCKNITVVSPMEVLGVKDSVEGVRSVMSDGVHLNKDALDRVVDHMIQGSRSCSSRKSGGRPRGRARLTRSQEWLAGLPVMGGGAGAAVAVGAGGGGSVRANSSRTAHTDNVDVPILQVALH